MPKFKISVSKNQKKYSIVLSAGTENEARKKVHSEGYSILGVEEFKQESIIGHKFFFKAIDKNGIIKKGKVVAKDPFKVYVKLRKGLKYDVKYLYSQDEGSKTEIEKEEIVAHLEEQYELYIKHTKKSKTGEDQKKEKEKEKEKKNVDNFYLKKELDDTYRLIEFVLIKIKNLIDKAGEKDLKEEKKEKLQTLYNSIVKIKKTTNIEKLKEIGELGLKKIGEIELEILEKYKDGNSKKLLNETNDLLKKIGSKQQFIEKNKDINYLMKKFISGVSEKISVFRGGKKKKEEGIDKESASYWKTELLIKKYEDKKRANLKAILKNIHKFILPFGKNKDDRNEILIRRKIISQNITILNAKKTGKLVSYTKVIKGYRGIIDFSVLFLKLINDYLFIIAYLFSLVFLMYLLGIKGNILNQSINVGGIFTLVYLLFGIILIFMTRGVFSLAINIALFIFLFIFGVVNF